MKYEAMFSLNKKKRFVFLEEAVSIEVQRYADRRNLSFSAAIRELVIDSLNTKGFGVWHLKK